MFVTDDVPFLFTVNKKITKGTKYYSKYHHKISRMCRSQPIVFHVGERVVQKKGDFLAERGAVGLQ